MKIRFMSFLLILGLLAIGQVFANGAAEEPEKVSESGLDISEQVELQFWMLGNEAEDLQMIENEVNKMALEDLNCTVKYNFTTWTDWPQKYRLLLTSGQPVDLIFTAEWTEYQRYARSGAFLELDDIVPDAAPILWDFVPQDYWDAVRVGGSIYTMPNTWKEYVYDGFEYREDLRKKYGVPEIDSIEDIEAYLDAIVANEPDMMPLGESGIIGSGFEPVISITAEMLHPWLDRGMPHYGLVADNDAPRDMYLYWGSEDHLADLKRFREWSQKGYWSRSILSSQEPEMESFQQGKLSARMAGINPVKFSQDVLAMSITNPEWEVGYYPFSRATGVVHPVHPTHNGFAVPIASENPERAVAFYEKMVTDFEYNRLTNYGIEGVHYNDSDGYYEMIGDRTTNGFHREAMQCWAWRNPEYMLFDQSFDIVKEFFAEFDKIATPDYYNGFAEDYAPFQSERTALEQVVAEYLAPLQAGLVEDVEAGLKTFMDKAWAAGMATIHEEYIAQWEAYCDEMGL